MPSQSPPSCSPPPQAYLQIASVLYADTLTELRDAVTIGSRTVLLTGSDSISRRALATLALPNAHIASCLSALLQSSKSSPVLLSLIDVAREKALILHDVDESTALPALLGLFDVAPRTFGILATANQPTDVSVQLRRVHRLDALVHVRAPSTNARTEAARVVAKLLGNDADSRLAHKIGSAAPVCGVGAFTVAAAAYYTAPKENAINAFLTAAPRASPLPYASVLSSDKVIGMNAVGGYEDVKKLLIDALGVDEKREATMKRLGVRPPRGVLLHGTRGVGKTTLARAMAAQTPTRVWLYVPCGDIYSRYLGESEARVRKLFSHARECAPCVVVLDDVDALAVNREMEDEGGTGVERRVLGALLAEMDGVNTLGRDGVQVLACTAKVESIDKAILRPGRFDRIIKVGLPTLQDRIEILKVVAMRMPVGRNGEDKIRALEKVARRTEGKTGADLGSVCRRAALYAMAESEKPDVVLERHLIKAVEEICDVSSDGDVHRSK